MSFWFYEQNVCKNVCERAGRAHGAGQPAPVPSPCPARPRPARPCPARPRPSRSRPVCPGLSTPRQPTPDQAVSLHTQPPPRLRPLPARALPRPRHPIGAAAPLRGGPFVGPCRLLHSRSGSSEASTASAATAGIHWHHTGNEVEWSGGVVAEVEERRWLQLHVYVTRRKPAPFQARVNGVALPPVSSGPEPRLESGLNQPAAPDRA